MKIAIHPVADEALTRWQIVVHVVGFLDLLKVADETTATVWFHFACFKSTQLLFVFCTIVAREFVLSAMPKLHSSCFWPLCVNLVS